MMELEEYLCLFDSIPGGRSKDTVDELLVPSGQMEEQMHWKKIKVDR